MMKTSAARPMASVNDSTAAFQEFASRRMGREEKPAIRDRLEQAKEQAERKPEHRTLDREKVKTRDRSVQR